METINKYIAELNTALEGIKWGEHPKELYDPIDYILELGGKRMRPLLVLLAYLIEKDDYHKVLKPALAVEVFHNFTLMHDDIMDKAPLRRGKPTVHEKWDENIAILSGDTMLVKAYDLMLNVDQNVLAEVIAKFNKCAVEVCEGQQLDMNFESFDTVSEAEYIDMIRLKTAVLLGFSLELGGILSSMKSENARLLKDFGINIGIGFQLKDDLLDVYGDAAKFGKQVGGDIVSNKKTFLLLTALEQAKGKEKEELQYWIDQKEFDIEEKVNAVTAIYNKLDIQNQTRAKIDHYFKIGFEALDTIDAPDGRKAPLMEFANYLINREK